MALIIAVLLDFALGDPKFLPHPVILIGKIIDFWRKIFLTDTHSFFQGLAVCIMTLTTTGLLVFIVLYISDCNFLVQVYLLYSALAWRDLKDETAPVVKALMKCEAAMKRQDMKNETVPVVNVLINKNLPEELGIQRDIHNENISVVNAVMKKKLPETQQDMKDDDGLMNKNLLEARKYLSFVVGRDTQNLNETEIVRALIETIAENSVDGVFSVMFFAMIGQFINSSWGMCLFVWLFKAASTLDSMIGYEEFHEFGTASARLDDVLNFLPARLGGVIIILAGALMSCDVKQAMKVFLDDRLKHKSPNSAHGESAFAGVLGVKLGGGAFYSGKFEARPSINSEGREPEIFDIIRAWKLLDVSCAIFTVIIYTLMCYFLRVLSC